MTIVSYLRFLHTMAWIIAAVVVLFRCVPLIRELRAYSGSSKRTNRHKLLRMYQIMIKPWGLVCVGLLLYYGLQYACYLPLKNWNVVYNMTRNDATKMFIGFAAVALAFPLYAIFERLIMKRILKDEYLDYCFWEIELSNHPKPPPKRGQVVVESFKTMRVGQYGWIFVCVLLCIVFAASMAEVDAIRFVSDNGIYLFREDGYQQSILFSEIESIEQAEIIDAYIVTDHNGTKLYVDPEIVAYISEQSGISYEPHPAVRPSGGQSEDHSMIDSPSDGQ